MDMEIYLLTIGRVNQEWGSKAEPLERQLKELETKYKALRPLGVDAGKIAMAKTLEDRISATAKRLNEVYHQWRSNVRLIGPPSRPEGDWTDKIPWPSWVSNAGKEFVLHSIKQGGLAMSDRVTLKKGPGMAGLIEIKW